MLKAHLDPSTAAASRPPAQVDATVAWIVDRLGLQPGAALVDLGCGPGLYSRRFASLGLQVTGVDLSANSIEHAREQDPLSSYRCMDYLDFDETASFDVVTLIYGDYNTFSDEDRGRLLDRVRRALVPGGWFVFDVTTRAHHEVSNSGSGWSAHPEGGFWRPGPHVVLARHHMYGELDLALDQYIVLDADGELRVYRNWFRYFDAGAITAELEQGGFVVRDLYSDLAGSQLNAGGPWIGVVAQRT